MRPIVPVVIHGNGKSFKTYCLLDGGATRTVIHEDIVNELNLPLESRNMRVITIDSIKEGSRSVVDFKLSNLDGDYNFDVSKALVGDMLTLEGDVPPSNKDVEGFSHLEGVNFEELPDKKIGMILSAEYAWSWMGGECRRGARGEPVGFRSCWGWAMIGCSGSTTSDEISHYRLDVNDLELREDMSKVFGRDFEDIRYNKKCPSVQDNHAMKQLHETIEFDSKLGHWRVGIPWETTREEAADVLNSVDSSTPARNRLVKSAEMLRRDPVKKDMVMKQMNDMIDEGHIKKVDPKMEHKHGVPYWVMPSLFVTHPNKPGKIRVCQDAKASVKGVSLNSKILTGPDVANSLLGVLFRFRRHKVIVSADIKGFYHQVLVDDNDKQVCRFWWYEDEEMTKMALFEITVHMMGGKSSATVATFVLHHHAETMRGTVPDEVLEEVLRSFYVDDFISSFPDVDAARKMRTQLTAVLKAGGFDLCKWKSTHEEVLEEEERVGGAEKVFGEVEDVADKVLGVAFSFDGDCLSFKIPKEKIEDEIKTRRGLLRRWQNVMIP